MTLIKISSKEAYKIFKKLGMDFFGNKKYYGFDDDQRVFYATNEERTNIWGYGSDKEREEAIERNRQYNEFIEAEVRFIVDCYCGGVI